MTDPERSEPSILAIVPAYNAERSLGAVLDALLRAGFDQGSIRVVNDGSTDQTGEEVLRLSLIHI